MHFFKQNIRFLREARGLSLKAFAERIHQSQEWVVKCEQGIAEPPLKDLLTLADFFHLPVDKLLRVDLIRSAVFNAEIDIRFLLIDIDGVLTDGGMYYTEGGDEFKKFNTKDGMGIKQAIKAGLRVGLISSGFNEKLIRSRAKLLGIELVYVGEKLKEMVLVDWLDKLQINDDNVAYIGDDINDLSVMRKVGLSACPADAVAAVKNMADVILSRNGGDACVREFIDGYLLASK